MADLLASLVFRPDRRLSSHIAEIITFILC